MQVKQPVTGAHSRCGSSGVVSARWGITANRENHWMMASRQAMTMAAVEKLMKLRKKNAHLEPLVSQTNQE